MAQVLIPFSSNLTSVDVIKRELKTDVKVISWRPGKKVIQVNNTHASRLVKNYGCQLIPLGK